MNLITCIFSDVGVGSWGFVDLEQYGGIRLSRRTEDGQMSDADLLARSSLLVVFSYDLFVPFDSLFWLMIRHRQPSQGYTQSGRWSAWYMVVEVCSSFRSCCSFA
jgi:hypothetical protein